MEAKQRVGKCKLLCSKRAIHLVELHAETLSLEYLSGLYVLQANPQAQHIAFSQAPEVDAMPHVSCYCKSELVEVCTEKCTQYRKHCLKGCTVNQKKKHYTMLHSVEYGIFFFFF